MHPGSRAPNDRVDPHQHVGRVTDEGGVRVDALRDFGAKSQRMDGHRIGCGERDLFVLHCVGLYLQLRDPPAGVERGNRVGERGECRFGVGDDTDGHRHLVAADLARFDVDLYEMVQMRKAAVAEEVVELFADDEEHVGLRTSRSANRDRSRADDRREMPPRRLACDDRDAAFDERAELVSGMRPPHAASGDDCRALVPRAGPAAARSTTSAAGAGGGFRTLERWRCSTVSSSIDRGSDRSRSRGRPDQECRLSLP